MSLELPDNIIYAIIDDLNTNYFKLLFVCKRLQQLLVIKSFPQNLNYIKHRIIYGPNDMAWENYLLNRYKLITPIPSYDTIWQVHKNDILKGKYSNACINIFDYKYIASRIVYFLRTRMSYDLCMECYNLIFERFANISLSRFEILYVVCFVKLIDRIERYCNGFKTKDYPLLKNMFAYFFRMIKKITDPTSSFINDYIKSTTGYKLICWEK